MAIAEVQMPEVFISTHMLYWEQFDKLHVLHNAQYIVLFEHARWEFWAHLGEDIDLPGADWPYYVASNTVNYRKAVREPQPVTIEVQVVRMKRVRLVMKHTLLDKNGDVCAEGEIVLVRVDRDTLKPISWSNRLKELVLPYTVEP